jgi:hypothetical protein
MWANLRETLQTPTPEKSKEVALFLVEQIQRGNLTDDQQLLVIVAAKGIHKFVHESPLPLQKQLLGSYIKFLELVSPDKSSQAIKLLGRQLLTYCDNLKLRSVRRACQIFHQCNGY